MYKQADIEKARRENPTGSVDFPHRRVPGGHMMRSLIFTKNDDMPSILTVSTQRNAVNRRPCRLIGEAGQATGHETSRSTLKSMPTNRIVEGPLCTFEPLTHALCSTGCQVQMSDYMTSHAMSSLTLGTPSTGCIDRLR